MQSNYPENNKYKQYFDYKSLRELMKNRDSNGTELCQVNLCNKDDQSYQKFKVQFNLKPNDFSLQEQRAIGSFLGLLLGDALGAHTEFYPMFQDDVKIKNGFADIHNFKKKRCEVGRHTDDCSMAKCIAESLLSNNLETNGQDCRLRYLLWINFGYCNGSPNSHSFGLGFNISDSLRQFMKVPEHNVQFKNSNRFINGCGSVMRLAPCALVFSNTNIALPEDKVKVGNSEQEKRLYATKLLCEWSSLTTHDGLEAADCCILLGIIIHQCIVSEKKESELKAYVIAELPFWAEMYCESKSVQFLAKSKQEETLDWSNYPEEFNKNLKDRNWNWKINELNTACLSHTRCTGSKGTTYYGSYVMDCMFIAFHIIYVTNSFKEALIMAANLGGDCDSFGSVVGQIAGAIYGLPLDILELYRQAPEQYDRHHTPYLAYRLFNRQEFKDQLVGYNFDFKQIK